MLFRKKNKNDDVESVGFLEKIKTDKKYKAKVELIGYVLIIVLIVIYLNISNLRNNYNYDSPKNVINENTSEEVDNQEDEGSFIDKINDNYSYSVDVEINQKIDGNDVFNKYNYNGKSYKENMIINRVTDSGNITYYKVNDKYYVKDNDAYVPSEEKNIYDLVDGKYLELDGLKKYIKMANLDHYTNYSSGKKEYVYNLKVSDVIQNYKGEEVIIFNIVYENDVIDINSDYTDLFKLMNDKIINAVIKYQYKDIDTVEEFTIIDEKLEENNN